MLLSVDFVMKCISGHLQAVDKILQRKGFHFILVVVRDSSADHSVHGT